MAQINKPTDYFNTVLYTGNDSTQSITGVGFRPDLWWNKSRSGTHNAGVHCLYDSVRGTTKRLQSNATTAEATISGVTSFDSDGVTLGSENQSNGGSTNYVAWNWLAGGTASSNTDGSITSSVSANTTAGFSIVSYTGNSTSGATVGHGLNAVPSMIIWKNLGTDSWGVYHKSIGNTNALFLDLTNASTSFTTLVNSTTPSSSVITLGSSTNSNNSGGMIAYCFAEKKGYSKFGSYTGNGNDDGTFIYTGFKPAWIMVKSTSNASEWNIFDVKRNPYNLTNLELEANTSDAEANVAEREMDILSNGFKFRGTSGFTNASGYSYIYMAFAEQPLVGTNNIPCTAR